jgi:NDP-sugar pyrophosphorylase family protein
LKAVVLAGGRGTRLRPYTTVLPKPLMPVGELPILEILIRQLKAAGCSEIILAVGYLAQLIQAYCGDGSRWGVSIRYSYEKEPLGTAGPLGLIEGLDSPFLVMNGDVLTSLDFRQFYRFHLEHGTVATICLYKSIVKLNLGVIRLGELGKIVDYVEKPSLEYQVSTGIYAFNPDILSDIPKGGYLDLPDLVRSLIARNIPVRPFLFDGVWLDIGNPGDYEKAVELFIEKPSAILPSES